MTNATPLPSNGAQPGSNGAGNGKGNYPTAASTGLGRRCRFVDLSGKKFGKLTVERMLVVNERPWNRPHTGFWLCTCDCGNSKVIRADGLKNRKLASCGCVKAVKSSSLPGQLKAQRNFSYGVKNSAKNRGYTCSMTHDEIVQVASQPCYYCGNAPSSVGKCSNRIGEAWIHNGLDRVDNSKGYETGNVVACCPMCNHAKHVHSAESFIEMCRAVARRHCE